ncbi:hypothetical protein GQR58_009063 [Nymphon striatum]|nr:hypothetical protein GQR58_009063 [Nymphon striatum]
MLVFRNSTSRVLNHHNWWFETPKVDAAELQPLLVFRNTKFLQCDDAGDNARIYRFDEEKCKRGRKIEPPRRTHPESRGSIMGTKEKWAFMPGGNTFQACVTTLKANVSPKLAICEELNIPNEGILNLARIPDFLVKNSHGKSWKATESYGKDTESHRKLWKVMKKVQNQSASHCILENVAKRAQTMCERSERYSSNCLQSVRTSWTGSVGKNALEL